MARRAWEEDSLYARRQGRRADESAWQDYQNAQQQWTQMQRGKGEMGESLARLGGKAIGAGIGFFVGGPGGAKIGAGVGDAAAGGIYDAVDQRAETMVDTSGFNVRPGTSNVGFEGPTVQQKLKTKTDQVNLALDKLNQSANTRHLTSPIKSYMQADKLGKAVYGSDKWATMGVKESRESMAKPLDWVKGLFNKGVDPTAGGDAASAVEKIYGDQPVYKVPTSKELGGMLSDVGDQPKVGFEPIQPSQFTPEVKPDPYPFKPKSSSVAGPDVYNKMVNNQRDNMMARNQQMIDTQNRFFSPQQQEFQMNRRIQMNEMQKNYRTQLNRVQDYSDKQTNINKEPVLNSRNDTISSKIENEVIYNQNEPLFDSDTTKIDDPTQVPTINLDNAPGIEQFVSASGLPMDQIQRLSGDGSQYQFTADAILKIAYGVAAYSGNMDHIQLMIGQGSNWKTRVHARYKEDAPKLIQMIENLEKSGEITLPK